jgi:hypothetical protein
VIRKRVKAVGKGLLKRLDKLARPSAPNAQMVQQKAQDAALEAANDPPVVARLVVEIRSDGTRTVARGAMEDIASGERVAVRAEGGSPIQLAGSLAKSMLSVPALALQAARTVAEASKKKGGGS